MRYFDRQCWWTKFCDDVVSRTDGGRRNTGHLPHNITLCCQRHRRFFTLLSFTSLREGINHGRGNKRIDNWLRVLLYSVLSFELRYYQCLMMLIISVTPALSKLNGNVTDDTRASLKQSSSSLINYVLSMPRHTTNIVYPTCNMT